MLEKNEFGTRYADDRPRCQVTLPGYNGASPPTDAVDGRADTIDIVPAQVGWVGVEVEVTAGATLTGDGQATTSFFATEAAEPCENNRSTKLNSDVMDVTMDVVAAASGSAEASRNGKRLIDAISDHASTCSHAQSAAGNSSNKKACLPRRVSTIPGDVRSSLLMVGGQAGAGKGETRHRRRTDGTATPGLITPSSSFLVGSIDPTCTVAAILEEEEAKETKNRGEIQCEECRECQIVEKEPGDAVQIAPKEVAATDTIDAETKAQILRPISSKTSLLRRILPLIILIEAALLVAERVFDLPFDPTFSLHEAPIHPDSVYVPGAGFSGYWFTLGRLKSIPDPASKSYYCYSAGCLGVVATLADKNMQEMSDLAFGVQRKWKEGRLDRYDVVSHFVDGLLFNSSIKNATAPIMSDANLLSKINVITSAKAIMGVRPVIRTPQSIDELRDMLLHTTWIPWATGDGLWVEDVLTGNHHMDGAFSATTHPRCTHQLSLPFMLDLFLNILNVNLGRDKVEKYWNAGVELGI